jgi:D-hexose-6-phosphate mutarotase
VHPYVQVSDLEQVRLEGFPAQCFNHLSGSEVPTADQLRRLPEGVDLRVDLPEPEPQALRLNQLQLQLEPPFRHAVVWSDPPRPMVCLEPWSAVRGALSQQLLPGERQWLRCRYRLLE